MTARIAAGAMFSLTLGALSLSAHAEPNKVASGMGHDLAQVKCSSCHLIEPGQKNAPDHVGGPSFQTVADRPGTTEATLRKHLQTTHASGIVPLSMPNPNLSQDELNKIIHYLVSLKTAEKS
jgi:mono/diheme cytochrome c family protein